MNMQLNEAPKFCLQNPTDEDHAILVNREDDECLIVPLSLEGVTSYFHTFKPTAEQYEAAEEGIDLFHLTDQDLEWEPHSDRFAQQETAMLDDSGWLSPSTTKVSRQILRVHVEQEIMFDDFANALANNRCMSAIRSSTVDRGRVMQSDSNFSAVSSMAKPQIEMAKLAKMWGIGLEAAKNTIKNTTQRAVRTILHPSLSRRFRTNDRQLRYRRLPVNLFTDTLLTKVKSRRGNLYCQVFGATNGWKCVFPMANKLDAHEALSLLFHRDGAPPEMVMDRTWEQIYVKFKMKCQEASVHVKQIEPHSPWQDAAENVI